MLLLIYALLLFSACDAVKKPIGILLFRISVLYFRKYPEDNGSNCFKIEFSDRKALNADQKVFT